ncbi:carbonic anhydrase family protein [Thiomicrorhabdus sp. zzn3]|uniref:carbonic anhydrase n=1 Tax=Thiomicrorhabdus sp. zzn3 TaxID=3039775 RepID=UPI0024366906|nr:carbonic anhydrase family protein [Thiomicrorhabdus sp. zzn3]MDG6778395.1 carbonic anhydrase family protein [Thiomicrorhabdus sp. zzn3]
MRRDLYLTMLVAAASLLNAGAGLAADKAEAPLLDLGAELKSLTGHEPAPATPTEKPQAAPTKAPAVTQGKTATKTTPAVEHVDAEHPPHWGYSGAIGPKYWGELSSEFATCKTGRNQSPIDLRDQHALGTQGLPELDIAYKEVPLKILNNGHAVQVNYPLGSYIKVGGHRYELIQYHFHTPSEHHKEGFAYPMEMHLVHRDGDGNIAVLGILFQEGEENPYLNGLLKRLPKEVGKEQIHTDLKLNPVHFLPPNTEFYKYSGSLTTPPCSEGVYWMVFKHPIEASALQIQKINELLGENARPVQPIYSRSLLKSWMEPDTDRQLYEFY